jgi:hypothetical protein
MSVCNSRVTVHPGEIDLVMLISYKIPKHVDFGIRNLIVCEFKNLRSPYVICTLVMVS